MVSTTIVAPIKTPRQRLKRGISLIRSATTILDIAKINALVLDQVEYDLFAYHLDQLYEGYDVLNELFKEITSERGEKK